MFFRHVKNSAAETMSSTKNKQHEKDCSEPCTMYCCRARHYLAKTTRQVALVCIRSSSHCHPLTFESFAQSMFTTRDCTVPPQCPWFARRSSFLSLHLTELGVAKQGKSSRKRKACQSGSCGKATHSDLHSVHSCKFILTHFTIHSVNECFDEHRVCVCVARYLYTHIFIYI